MIIGYSYQLLCHCRNL